MRLYSCQPSGYLENGTNLNTTEVTFDPDSIQWYQEIPLSEAKLILERTMYPFKKVGKEAPSCSNSSIVCNCSVQSRNLRDLKIMQQNLETACQSRDCASTIREHNRLTGWEHPWLGGLEYMPDVDGIDGAASAP